MLTFYFSGVVMMISDIKTWANKLELHKKLHSLSLKNGESVQNHIRKMTELFRDLAEMDTALTEEDKVIHLLASLLESFGVLSTARGQYRCAQDGSGY